MTGPWTKQKGELEARIEEYHLKIRSLEEESDNLFSQDGLMD